MVVDIDGRLSVPTDKYVLCLFLYYWLHLLISIVPTLRALAGMAVARDMQGRGNSVVAVIGDGAMTAGQAYEAMNNAGYLDSNLIVILNDNKQVSLPTATLDGPAPPVGALSSALSKLQSSTKLRKLREAAKVFFLVPSTVDRVCSAPCASLPMRHVPDISSRVREFSFLCKC